MFDSISTTDDDRDGFLPDCDDESGADAGKSFTSPIADEFLRKTGKSQIAVDIATLRERAKAAGLEGFLNLNGVADAGKSIA